ncbi:MAG: hypothetical protein QM486_11585 [Flavobacteriaceae bacterium]
MKTPYKVKCLVYFYGDEIIHSLILDDLLKQLQLQGSTQYHFNRIPTTANRDLQKDLDFLVAEGLIKAYMDNYYDITKKGDLKLASGGFVADVKTNKNALFAFKISLVAITISIISFLASLLSD